MSSLAALFCRRGEADARTLAAMLDAMAFRAPDGRAARLTGPAGMGVGLLATARDGLAEAPDGLVVILDGRLDYGADLARALGIERPASDAELLLSAYRRWGREVARQLEGDFAFAVWDPLAQRLLVARDPLGVRPVYYNEAAGRLVVASHPAAIAAAAPAATAAIDRGVVAAFAAGEAWPVERTAFTGVRRLAPGTILVGSRHRLTIERYHQWRITPRRRGEQPPERFAELLRDAVATRMETSRPIGAMLSGGLDSSSIVGLAAPLARARGLPPLPTYSQVYPNNPDGDERPFIDAIIAQGGLRPTFVEEEDIAPFGSYPSLLDEQFMPVIAPNIATLRHTIDRAAQDGVRVLFDGHGGDETVSHGIRWWRDLAYRLRMLALWRTIRPYAAAQGYSPRRVFYITMRRFGPWRSGRLPTTTPAPWLAASAAPALAPTVADIPGDESRTGHLVDTAGAFSTQANEVSNHLASARGIELRFPLLDRRLIEWCIAAPGEEKLADGHSRVLLRRGMAGILPEAVRWRGDKHDFTGNVARGLLRDAAVVEAALDDRDGGLAMFFNVPTLKGYWQALRERPGEIRGLEVQAIWRAVLLARWLDRHGGRMTEAGE